MHPALLTNSTTLAIILAIITFYLTLQHFIALYYFPLFSSLFSPLSCFSFIIMFSNYHPIFSYCFSLLLFLTLFLTLRARRMIAAKVNVYRDMLHQVFSFFSLFPLLLIFLYYSPLLLSFLLFLSLPLFILPCKSSRC